MVVGAPWKNGRGQGTLPMEHSAESQGSAGRVGVGSCSAGLPAEALQGLDHEAH